MCCKHPKIVKTHCREESNLHADLTVSRNPQLRFQAAPTTSGAMPTVSSLRVSRVMTPEYTSEVIKF
jgi:hypothetical protein